MIAQFDGELPYTAIVVVRILVSMFAFVLLYLTCYRKVGPNEALILCQCAAPIT